MRLIDADRLKEAIHTDFSEHFTLYQGTDQMSLIDMVMDDIDEMPTAFDKEKVIEKIKCERDEAQDYNQYSAVAAHEIDIDIVEKGGIE